MSDISRKGPSSNREHYFQVSILLLKKKQLLNATIGIIPCPAFIIIWERFLDSGISIKEVHRSIEGVDICESVVDMGERFGIEKCGSKALVDSLLNLVTPPGSLWLTT